MFKVQFWLLQKHTKNNLLRLLSQKHLTLMKLKYNIERGLDIGLYNK